MQKAYNKLDIVVNIAVCTRFKIIFNFHIGLVKSVNMNHVEDRANCYIVTIASYLVTNDYSILTPLTAHSKLH